MVYNYVVYMKERRLWHSCKNFEAMFLHQMYFVTPRDDDFLIPPVNWI